MSSNLRVAIIGAGPAGCILSRLLHLNNSPFTIFEGEASYSIRSQGSTLDPHTLALEALKECNLYDEFKKHARYDGEGMVIADKNYRVLFQQAGKTEESSQGRPEIDRSQLRQMLVKSLPAGAIKWDHRLRSVDDDGSLHFDHGIEKWVDLVNGADGAWSKIRPKLTDIKLFYSVNRGSLFLFSDGKGLQPQQLGDGSIHMYTWSKRPEDWMETCGFDPYDSAAARKHLAELFEDWNPQLRKFTQVADESHLEPRNLYMLPVGIYWQHRPGFTFVGDAAHLMTPFAGEGVNLAIVDALNIARAIIKSHESSLDENIQKFEEEMFERVEPVQQETKTNLDGFFNEEEGALEIALIDMMAEAPQEMAAQVRDHLMEVGTKKTKNILAQQTN